MANEKAHGPSQFVTEAYQVDDEASVVGFYAKWADDYDNQMHGLGYLSPQYIAKDLHAHLHNPQAVLTSHQTWYASRLSGIFIDSYW